MLDNKNTGDIRFVCLETGNSNTLAASQLQALAQDSSPPLEIRKRVLYAHSDILKHRSEYFRDLLEFRADNRLKAVSDSMDERRIETVYCIDTDLATLYWTLAWIYSNRLRMVLHQDHRKVLDWHGVSGDPLAKRILGMEGYLPLKDAWAWHRAFSGNETELDESPNLETGPDATESSPPDSFSQRFREDLSNVGSSGIEMADGNHADSSMQEDRKIGDTSSTAAQERPTPQLPAANQFKDPHAHPTQPPPSASAFRTYVLADQYSLDELQQVTHQALLENLTPAKAMSLLFASYRYKDLHDAVTVWIQSNWDAVKKDVSNAA